MPTAKNNRLGNEAQRALPNLMEGSASDDDHLPTTFEKAKTATLRFAFPIVLLVAIVVVWWILFSMGQSLSKNQNPMGKIIFPTNAAPVLVWYGLVVMAYPAFKAAVRLAAKRTDQFEMVRMGIAVGTTILGFLLIRSALTTLQGLGVTLWGLRFPGLGALVLCALASYLLTIYKPDNEQLKKLERDLPGLEENVSKTSADLKLKSNTEENKRKYLELIKSKLKNREEKSAKARANYDTIEKSLNSTPDAIKKAELSETLANAQTELGVLQTNIKNMKDQITDEDDPMERSRFEGEQQEQYTRRKQLRTEIDGLSKEVVALQKQIDNSSLKTSVDAAKERFDGASREVDQTKRQLDTAKEEHKTARNESKTASGLLRTSETDRNDVQQEIANIYSKRKSLWRDDLWVSVISPLVLWGLAIIGYTTWFGWVIVEFSV